MPSASRLRTSPRRFRRWYGCSARPARPPARSVPPRPDEPQRGRLGGWSGDHVSSSRSRENGRMFERILAAIDSDPERSTRVVAAAQELARAFGSQLVVAHVRDVERPAATLATARASALPPALHVESEEEARALVDAAVERRR